MATPIRPDLPQLPQLPHLRRNAVLVVIGLVVLLIIVFPALVRFTASWYWYKEIGFQTILVSEIVTRSVLMVGAGLAAFALLYVNVRIAQRRARPLPAVMDDMISIAPNLPPAVVRRIATVIAIFFSLLTGVTVSAAWLTVLRFMNGVPFGVNDPMLGNDIGFYAYTLPVLSGVMAFLMTLTVIATLMTGGVYLANGAIAFQGQLFRVSRAAGVHVAAMLAVFFILTAVQIWLVGIPNLLFASTGPFTGASYTDVNVHRAGMYAGALAALAAAGIVIFGIARHKSVKFFAAAVGLYMGVSLIGRALIPALVQRLVVAPTELTKERPYLANHIDATRRAWGLDSVATRDVRGESSISPATLRASTATIENVRLWDREPLRQTFGQIQEIRTYYEFGEIDDDRYWIDGRYRQVHLSPRELNSASLPTRSFINEHLTFTHGMGVTLAPVNQVTEEGLPVLFIKDLPPVSSVSLRLTRPQIYYGELTNSYAVVGTRQREFDHPAGDANIFANYTGSGGVRLNSFVRRALLAWHFGSLKLLLSQDIRSDSSRILYHRNILERAARALPFVRFDRDPYIVITDAGELKWLLDAYTTTAGYPYSQRLPDGTSYMRNSVKVMIDAYDGTVRAFIADPHDPIVRTWAAVFPGILLPLDSMPADVRAHVRYPEDLFRLQTALYTTYHMTEPETFYNREDQWQIPSIQQGDAGENAFMRRIVMRLPEEDSAEFIFMSPFTPRGKDNLAAWMVARNDGDHYGELLVYRFPKQSLVFGPQQVINRMNQDPEIARQVSLWDQRGSQVVRGALMVIPIEESLIYVQPLYMRAEGGPIHELQRVIVAYQNQVVMEETLEGGLARVFAGLGDAGLPPSRVAVAGEAAVPPAATGAAAPNASTADLLRRATQHYDRAIEAQRAGNWSAYGAEIERLGAVLRQLTGAQSGASGRP